MPLVNIDEQQLIDAIRQGGKPKREAVQQLFLMHQGMMQTIKTKLNLSSESAKDMYADAVSSVIWNIEIKKFKGNSKLSTYFYRIFYNKSVDHLRHTTTNKNEAYFELEEDSNLVASENDSRQLETKLDVEKVKWEIQQLGKPCNSIIIDWAYWGYSMAEIAERNGLESADKVKKKKYNCLQKLRSVLHAKGMN